MLVNSAFFWNASVATIFSSSPACLSVDRGRNNSQMSLDSIAFFWFFCLWVEIYKLEIFKSLPFTKIKYSRNKIFFNSKKQMHVKIKTLGR